MNAPALDARRVAQIRRAALAAAAIVVGIGLAVLAGWVFDIGFLRGPVPGTIEMKANTAIAFVLGGGALLLIQLGGRRRLPRLAGYVGASATLMIGAVTLVQYVSGANLGVDELLFEDDSSAALTVHPGRPSPQAALCFFLLGIALLMQHVEARRWRGVLDGFGITVGLVAMFALIGYAYGAGKLSTVAAFQPPAVHTAIGCLLLAVAVTFASPRCGVAGALARDTAGSVTARRLLPIALVIMPVLGWLRLQGETRGYYPEKTGVALFVLVVLLLFGAGVAWTARALNRADAERREAAIQQDRLAAIVESSGDAILSTEDGRITSWNRAAERLFGYAPDEIVGRPMSVLVPPELEGSSERVMARVAAGERVDQFEAEALRKDGELVDVSMSVAPITDAKGNVTGVSAIFRDVTERKRGEAEVREARDEAERANAAKSEFLSRMSHELRTPLNAILGFGQLLEMDDLDDQQRDNVGYILKGGRHLLTLIDEVLEISRIEAGNLFVSVEPVDAAAALREAASLIQPMASARGIDVAIEVDDGEERWAAGDLQRLKQVLLNLLSNAVKYNRDGGSIAVSIVKAPAKLRIVVADTGDGIPPEKLPRLFNPFDRLGAELSGIEGTGLGLALSRRLMEAMGGTLSADSELGAGTTFWLELPISANGARADLEDVAPAATDAVGSASMKPRTLLYVEDNLSNVKLVEQILERRGGLRVMPAMQGALGLELALEHAPDLILLDLDLPDMPGTVVLERLKADPRTREIAVVVLSADATGDRVDRLLDSGASSYLTKPLDVKRFLEVVEDNLGDRVSV